MACMSPFAFDQKPRYLQLLYMRAYMSVCLFGCVCVLVCSFVCACICACACGRFDDMANGDGRKVSQACLHAVASAKGGSKAGRHSPSKIQALGIVTCRQRTFSMSASRARACALTRATMTCYDSKAEIRQQPWQLPPSSESVIASRTALGPSPESVRASTTKF